jgi:hypothetical protein
LDLTIQGGIQVHIRGLDVTIPPAIPNSTLGPGDAPKLPEIPFDENEEPFENEKPFDRKGVMQHRRTPEIRGSGLCS